MILPVAPPEWSASSDGTPFGALASDLMERTSRVLVLYTGGTIGMRRNARGVYEPVKGWFAEQVRLQGGHRAPRGRAADRDAAQLLVRT